MVIHIFNFLEKPQDTIKFKQSWSWRSTLLKFYCNNESLLIAHNIIEEHPKYDALDFDNAFRMYSQARKMTFNSIISKANNLLVIPNDYFLQLRNKSVSKVIWKEKQPTEKLISSAKRDSKIQRNK